VKIDVMCQCSNVVVCVCGTGTEFETYNLVGAVYLYLCTFYYVTQLQSSQILCTKTN
jgi:hypothetical protein